MQKINADWIPDELCIKAAGVFWVAVLFLQHAVVFFVLPILHSGTNYNSYVRCAALKGKTERKGVNAFFWKKSFKSWWAKTKWNKKYCWQIQICPTWGHYLLVKIAKCWNSDSLALEVTLGHCSTLFAEEPLSCMTSMRRTLKIWSKYVQWSLLEKNHK